MVILTLAVELARGGWGPGAGPWWPIFPLLWIALWGVLVFAFFRFRRGGGWHRGPSAESVLGERYARGEIEADEYRERLSVLKQQGS